MRRADGLVAINRRELCSGLVAGIGLAIAACTDGNVPVIHTGPLGGGDDGDGPDAGVSLNPDAPMGSGSGSGSGSSGPQPTCPASGVTDVGAPSTFLNGAATYFSTGKFFVVRDAGGLYALTARCTHEGATCTTQSGHFYCPRHGATFAIDGSPTSGPVITGLVHYAMCTLANGHVGVILSQTVAKTDRLDA
jgi:nitrite reductase/ring-hydroxylating ferredoxin subunit